MGQNGRYVSKTTYNRQVKGDKVSAPKPEKGGELTKTTQNKPENPRRTRAAAKQAQAAKGTTGSSTRVAQTTQPARLPGAAPKALPPGKPGGALARGRGRGGGVGLALTGIALGRALGDAIAGPLKRAVRAEKGEQAAQSGQYGKYAPPERKTTPPPKTTPKATREPERNSSSSDNRSGGGGSGRSTPAVRPAGTQPSSSGARTAPAAKPAAPKERRVSGSTANRESGNYGTSRTNNKLMDGLRKGMRRREESKANEAGSKAMKATGTAKNFQQSGYEAKTKPGKDYSKASTTNQTSTAYGSKSLAGKDDNETTIKTTKMATGNKVGNADTPKNTSKTKSLKEMMDERKKRNQRTTNYGGY